MNPLPTRYIEAVGKLTELHLRWKNETPCKAYDKAHEATYTYPMDPVMGKERTDHTTDWDALPWATVCDHCGAPAPTNASRSIGSRFVYNNESGRPEPGDLYFRDERHGEDKCWCGWDNCDGFHLHAVLPTGDHWDIDSRASNCTLPNDGLHRCWVRHGDPRRGDLIHVDKNGLTCRAGAGSIVVPNWHGFLHKGFLKSC
jgi:hypothetical protein